MQKRADKRYKLENEEMFNEEEAAEKGDGEASEESAEGAEKAAETAEKKDEGQEA